MTSAHDFGDWCAHAEKRYQVIDPRKPTELLLTMLLQGVPDADDVSQFFNDSDTVMAATSFATAVADSQYDSDQVYLC